MDDSEILREEIARGIEANKTKSVLQMHFKERREQLMQGLLQAPSERLVEVRAALVELDRLEDWLDDIANSGRMAERQLEMEEMAAKADQLERDQSLN